jgi:hypothetical protein
MNRRLTLIAAFLFLMVGALPTASIAGDDKFPEPLFDKQVTGGDHRGQWFVWVRPTGAIDLQHSSSFQDSGKWTFKGGRFCARWDEFDGGMTMCATDNKIIERDGERLWDYLDEDSGERRQARVERQ